MSTEEQLKEEKEIAQDLNVEADVQEEAQADDSVLEDMQPGESAAEDKRYEELAKQAEENQQKYLRAQADFDNYRRRTLKEKEELAQYASMKLIEQLLPIIDNFERALAASEGSSDKDSLVKGLEMIFRQLSGTLEQEGLKPMNTVGEPFNPDFHQAVMQVQSDEHEEGIIVEEMQKGYILKEKVLRPAMVKVSG